MEKRPSQFIRARQAAGLSQSQAAKLIGIPQRELAHIENHDRLPVTWIQTAMEEYYGVSYWYLLTGVPHTMMDHIADGTPEDTFLSMLRNGDFERV